MKSLLEFKPDDIVCHCMDVRYAEICHAIQHDKKERIEELSQSLGVGLGCASCTGIVQEILDKISNS